MPKRKPVVATSNDGTLNWTITPYGYVNAYIGEEQVMGIALGSFYLSPEDAASAVEHVKFFCAYEGWDVRDTFGKLVAVVKAHFNLGTVMYMHMFEKFA